MADNPACDEDRYTTSFSNGANNTPDDEIKRADEVIDVDTKPSFAVNTETGIPAPYAGIILAVVIIVVIVFVVVMVLFSEDE